MLGVDIFVNYLEEIKYQYPTIHLSVTETAVFLDDSYDIVICTDVVEHLEREAALKLLYECTRVCRRTAIVYTPITFRNNQQPDGGAWGLGDNDYQLHRCIVTKEELERAGYKVTTPAINCHLAVYNK